VAHLEAALHPHRDDLRHQSQLRFFVGTELDIIAGWAMTRYAQLEAGYGHFFVGDYVEQSAFRPHTRFA
jgi:hypothetical protein